MSRKSRRRRARAASRSLSWRPHRKGRGRAADDLPAPQSGGAADGVGVEGRVQRQRAGRRTRDLALICAGLAALLALAYYPVLFGGETFVERDAIRFTLPSREFLVESLRSGHLPEWFDGVAFGAPFAANPVHEVLSPLGWTMALLPVPMGFDLYTLIHLLIGGLGLAAFSRRLGAGPTGSLLAAAALALGGYCTSMVPNGLAPAIAWTPWVAWAAEQLAKRLRTGPSERSRRELILTSLVFAAIFALQLPSGEPATTLIAAAVAWIVVLTRGDGRPLRSTKVLLFAGTGSLLRAAYAILPELLLLAGSARRAGIDAGGLEWSLHPARLLEAVWPAAFGSQHVDGWFAGLLLRDGPGDPFWSYTLFLGLPLLVAAGLAARERRCRRLLLATVPFLLLATGGYTPLYGWLARAVPPLRLVNFPEKFVYGALLMLTAVAGVGFTRLFAEGPSHRLRRFALASGALLALAVGATALTRPALLDRLERRREEWGVLMRTEAGIGAALRGGSVATGGALLFAAALALQRRAPRAAAALASVALLGPLVWAASRTTPFAPRSVLARTPRLLEQLPAPLEHGPRPRIFRLDPQQPPGPFGSGEAIARDYHESLDTNVAARFGFAVLPGFEPGQSAAMGRFGRDVFPRTNPVAFVRLLGVEWIAAHEPEDLALPFPLVAREESGWAILSAGAVRPAAFVTPRWSTAASPEETLTGLARPGREQDPGAVSLVGAMAMATGSQEPLSPCDARTTRPEEVVLTCDSPTGGYAIQLAELTPGWTATVDGREAEIHLADGLFRAVAIEPGSHEIVFRYRTPGLRLGAAVSLLAWLAWATALVATRSRGARLTTPEA